MNGFNNMWSRSTADFLSHHAGFSARTVHALYLHCTPKRVAQFKGNQHNSCIHHPRWKWLTFQNKMGRVPRIWDWCPQILGLQSPLLEIWDLGLGTMTFRIGDCFPPNRGCTMRQCQVSRIEKDQAVHFTMVLQPD